MIYIVGKKPASRYLASDRNNHIVFEKSLNEENEVTIEELKQAMRTIKYIEIRLDIIERKTGSSFYAVDYNLFIEFKNLINQLDNYANVIVYCTREEYENVCNRGFCNHE